MKRRGSLAPAPITSETGGSNAKGQETNASARPSEAAVPREGDEDENEVDDASGETSDEEPEDEDEDEEGNDKPTSVQTSQSSDAPLTPATTSSGPEVEDLTKSMSALKFVPPSLRFGRGRGKGGLARR